MPGDAFFFVTDVITFIDIVLIEPQVFEVIFTLIDSKGGRPVIPVVLKFRRGSKHTLNSQLLALHGQTQRNLVRTNPVLVSRVIPYDVYRDLSLNTVGNSYCIILDFFADNIFFVIIGLLIELIFGFNSDRTG